MSGYEAVAGSPVMDDDTKERVLVEGLLDQVTAARQEALSARARRLGPVLGPLVVKLLGMKEFTIGDNPEDRMQVKANSRHNPDNYTIVRRQHTPEGGVKETVFSVSQGVVAAMQVEDGPQGTALRHTLVEWGDSIPSLYPPSTQ